MVKQRRRTHGLVGIVAWSLEPAELTAILIGPSSRASLLGNIVESQQFPVIVIWFDSSSIRMLVDFYKYLIEDFQVFYFVHDLAQPSSIAVLNTSYKNVGKIVCEIAVVHVDFSAHSCQHIFDIFIMARFKSCGDKLLNLLNLIRAIDTTPSGRIVNLLVELPEVLNWVNNSRRGPRGDSQMWVFLSKPCRKCTRVASADNHDLPIGLVSIHGGDEISEICQGLLRCEVFEIRQFQVQIWD